MFAINIARGLGGGGILAGNFGTGMRACFFETYTNHIPGLREK